MKQAFFTQRISALGQAFSRSRLAAVIQPNLQDPNLARQQRLLNLMLFGLAFPGTLFGLIMLLLWALGQTPLTGAVAGLGIQPFYIISYWLGRKGHLTFAAAIPVGAVFLVMVGGGLQLGIGHVFYIGFVMATLTASILIGSRAGLLIAVLSTLANLAIGSLQAGGLLPGAIDPLSTVAADSIGMGLGLVVLIAFTGIYGNELKKALLIQQALSAELQVDQANLELQVRRRTRDLERRVIQIRTAAEISGSISAVLEPEQLLQRVVDLIQERFGLYYAGVFLVDEQQSVPGGPLYAVLRAGTGLAGEKMLAEGYKIALEALSSGESLDGVEPSSMIGWAIVHRRPRITLDVDFSEDEALSFHNPYLPHTRSELALPILTGGSGSTRAQRCLGALTFQSDQPNAFDEDDITVLQAIADSLATALENARLYQESQSSLAEIRNLHRQYLSRAWRGYKSPGFVWESDVAGTEKKGDPVNHLHYSVELNPPFSQPKHELAAKPDETTPGVDNVEVPLILRDQTIGSLFIESGVTPLSTDEIALIKAVATETAIALENARLLEETQSRAERERLLSEVNARVRASSHIPTILQTAIMELGRALNASEGFIRLEAEPPKQGELVSTQIAGSPQDDVPRDEGDWPRTAELTNASPNPEQDLPPEGQPPDSEPFVGNQE